MQIKINTLPIKKIQNVIFTRSFLIIFLQVLLILSSPIIIFWLIDSSDGIERISYIITKGSINIFFFLVPFLGLTIALNRKGWLKYLYTSIILSMLYGYLLKWYWITGFSHTTHLYGFLPTSDSATYFHEAYGLIFGDLLHGSSTFRPLGTLYFSSLFWLSNLNLKLSFWIMAYLNLISSLIASNEIRKTNGAIASAIYLIAGLFFLRYFIGTLMTEQLGFLLGNIAFASFWNGIRTKNPRIILLGLFLLSVGLNVRAGAMIILVTIPLWFYIYYIRNKKPFKWIIIILLITFSGFILNYLSLNLFSNREGALFSNFGYTLYGVAVGNKGWSQILIDHPGITSEQTLQLAIQQIMTNPVLFLKGVLNTYMDFFDPKSLWAFSFLRLYPTYQNVIILVLFVLGFSFLFKNRDKPYSKFLIFSLLGILLSVPFAPTRDVGYRTYTVTNPILVCILIMSFSWINNFRFRLKTKWIDNDNE
jgi:hypothetical protein